jgi:hypothetical protein
MPETLPNDDYDSPWKEALGVYFPECMRFFFPKAAADIDWTEGYRFLDKELQQVAPDALIGRRAVDKLVEVWRKSGQATWVLIHLEVQSQYDASFAERMYVYNYRIFDRYHKKVASFAILGDEHPNWRPNRYGYRLWDCEVSLTFPVVKLLDYQDIRVELAQHQNPFAIVVLAHLHTQATRGQPKERYALKWRLTRLLYERGYTKRDVQLLFRFIDWVMWLPPALKTQFSTGVVAYEKERNMTYVTETIQLFQEKAMQEGMEKGREEGVRQQAREAVLEVLNLRFSEPPPDLVERINEVEDPETLKALHAQAVLTESLEEFERFMAGSLGQPSQSSG